MKNNGPGEAVLESVYNSEYSDPELAAGAERERFYSTSGYTDSTHWGEYYNMFAGLGLEEPGSTWEDAAGLPCSS